MFCRSTAIGRDIEQRVVEAIRLLRVMQAVLVGAASALGGAALQGVFRNPLVGPQVAGASSFNIGFPHAEPPLVGPQVAGASSGAALGGVAAIFLALGPIAVIGSTFLVATVAVVCVYLIARTNGRAPVLILVLSGVVVGAFCSSMIALVTFFANPEDSLPAIVYWLMGSFATANFEKVRLLCLALVGAGVPLLALSFRINVLSLGDEEAAALGVKVERTRWMALVAVAALVAVSVSVSGIVGWVGLVVPHFARMLFGPNHQLVLPGSALIGATYMLLIDDIARTMSASEMPLGILTAIVGAPIFAYLLRQTRARGW